MLRLNKEFSTIVKLDLVELAHGLVNKEKPMTPGTLLWINLIDNSLSSTSSLISTDPSLWRVVWTEGLVPSYSAAVILVSSKHQVLSLA